MTAQNDRHGTPEAAVRDAVREYDLDAMHGAIRTAPERQRAHLALAAIREAVRSDYAFLALESLQYVPISRSAEFDDIIGEVANRRSDVLLHELFRRGAGIRLFDQTAELCSCSILERPHVVRRLIMAGASVDVRDVDGWTPFVHAAANRLFDTVRVLVENHATVDVIFGDSRRTVIHAMGSKADIGLEDLIVSYLAEQGIQIDVPDRDNETGLQYARSLDRPALVRALAAAGANVDVQDGCGFTPLSAAARFGQLECVQVLIGAGSRLDARDMHGGTPLINGAHKPHIVEALLVAGADVHAATDDGSTALHIAAQHNSVDSCALLVSHGADPTVTDQNGRNPLDVAISVSATDCIAYLMAATGQSTA